MKKQQLILTHCLKFYMPNRQIILVNGLSVTLSNDHDLNIVEIMLILDFCMYVVCQCMMKNGLLFSVVVHML